ncbi:5-oxoprolinase [Lathamus discolor]|uniref:5-oxoprolinase n=1 Tax=Lathamus discolor TaxID=678569 RepID=UPI0032B7E7E1
MAAGGGGAGLTSLSPESTSSSEMRLCPSRRSSPRLNPPSPLPIPARWLCRMQNAVVPRGGRCRSGGSAVFDFSGTGPEVLGNWNAPRAVTLAAIIYCVRCMVGQELPLNQGCLAPVRVLIPKGSILDPSPEAAVVGGNVLTSQRVVDVIFKAFGVCAASQGCMNNVTFGTARSGYYETVAGGAGAGPGWHGRSGGAHAHDQHPHHRPRDPRAAVPGGAAALRAAAGLGRRRALARRGRPGPGAAVPGAAGAGGCLSERRVLRPYGLRGGSPGAPGLNLLLRRDGRTINLGGKSSVSVEPGVSAGMPHTSPIDPRRHNP